MQIYKDFRNREKLTIFNTATTPSTKSKRTEAEVPQGTAGRNRAWQNGRPPTWRRTAFETCEVGASAAPTEGRRGRWARRPKGGAHIGRDRRERPHNQPRAPSVGARRAAKARSETIGKQRYEDYDLSRTFLIRPARRRRRKPSRREYIGRGARHDDAQEERPEAVPPNRGGVNAGGGGRGRRGGARRDFGQRPQGATAHGARAPPRRPRPKKRGIPTPRRTATAGSGGEGGRRGEGAGVPPKIAEFVTLR